jgi:hypothetical protein
MHDLIGRSGRWLRSLLLGSLLLGHPLLVLLMQQPKEVFLSLKCSANKRKCKNISNNLVW